MSLRRKLLPLLQTIIVLAAISYLGEGLLYSFGSGPAKDTLRVMGGTYVRPRSDELIEVAVPERGETYHRLFSLYPRIADRGRLRRGEQLKLLVSTRGVILQIESADSGVHWSYEHEQLRHRRVLNLSILVGVFALLGWGLLYLIAGVSGRDVET